MTGRWTFGQKIGAGFAVMAGLCVLTGGLATYALRTVVASKDRVIATHAADLIEAEKLHAAVEKKGSAGRAFLLTGDARFRDEVAAARTDFTTGIARLRAQATEPQVRSELEPIELAEADHQTAFDRAFASRPAGPATEAVARSFEEEIVPRRKTLDQRIASFVSLEEDLLARAKAASTATANAATLWMVVLMMVAVLFAIATAFLVARALTRQIGAAIQHIQSSSAELQAAASQQAAGARQQAMAMTEITTTINELLATSRQIAESAQRVAHIADETADGAGAGDQTVQRAQESILGIKRQVDAIVSHMLDLGRKSQQIGGVLEIINELAEQTNILATNATIEAAGAGDHGRRFAVVADEIRKLADRVGGSTKEVRGLIEDIRAAVNTTVMATEGGSKAVDAGTREFTDVASSFKQIASRVGTTTSAAREIELSTKQQATAVEQVNLAVSNVAQATKETETSSSQTLQTATQLTTLSRQLAALVQAEAA
jgi:methyl-accepting chemotaxis protein